LPGIDIDRLPGNPACSEQERHRIRHLIGPYRVLQQIGRCHGGKLFLGLIQAGQCKAGGDGVHGNPIAQSLSQHLRCPGQRELAAGIGKEIGV